MSKYLVTGNYNAEGAKGLMQEGGSKRLAAATAAIESVGGSVDSFYYAFGADDVIGIVDFPDDASATAVSLMINSSGAVSIKLTPLMTVEEIDAAAAKTASYRAPGT
ncbi:MAG: GYD domain-containing protein [Acidimicrobiaceae bacterium]|nr:GYD domain-containing protein [Acidimicrobiaceae bacterium]